MQILSLWNAVWYILTSWFLQCGCFRDLFWYKIYRKPCWDLKKIGVSCKLFLWGPWLLTSICWTWCVLFDHWLPSGNQTRQWKICIDGYFNGKSSVYQWAGSIATFDSQRINPLWLGTLELIIIWSYLENWLPLKPCIQQFGIVGAGSHRLQVSFWPGLLWPDAKLCLPCSWSHGILGIWSRGIRFKQILTNDQI